MCGLQVQAKQEQTEIRHRSLYPRLVSVLVVTAMLMGAYIYTSRLDNRITALETLTGTQNSGLTDMQDRLFSASLLEGRYASLDARITALGNAFTSMDDKLSLLVSRQLSPMEAVPPAGNADTVLQAPAKNTQTDTPVEISVSPTANAENTADITSVQEPVVADPVAADPVAADPVAADPVAAPVTGDGPWIINLMSSQDKHYVEQFARRANDADIPLALNSAEVKGKTYWRLQITGFESLDNARAYAGPVKESLGIKEVWYLKRK